MGEFKVGEENQESLLFREETLNTLSGVLFRAVAF